MKKWISVLFMILLTVLQSKGQTDHKKIKKQIPVKRITSLDPLFDSDKIYLYFSKSDTGIWDTETKKILISHLNDVVRTPFKESWILYSIPTEYGVYDINKGKKLVSSSTPIYLDHSSNPRLINIINSEILGFLDLKRDMGYWKRSGSPQDTTFFHEGKGGHSCTYNAETNSVNYGYGDPSGIDEFDEDYLEEEFTTIYHEHGFAWEHKKVYDLNSGEILLEYSGNIMPLKGGFVLDNYRSNSYYDKDLNLIFDKVRYDKFRPEHFQYFCDSTIVETEFVGNTNIYLCKSDSWQRFYSTSTMEPVSEEYDFTFSVGIDHINNGHSFFTVRDGFGYGLFNSTLFEIAKPEYTIIEKRAFPDGTHWYRADDNLHKAIKYLSDSSESMKWNPEMERTTTIITHLGVHGKDLVISLRSTSVDTHDAAYYTATYFDPGSGVIDLTDTTWRIRPEYHTITPYKDHYIAMKIGSTYRNASWLQATIFDDNFQPITDQKFGASFIFNDMLIIRQSNKYIEYDVNENRVIRDLGVINEWDADFEIVDGYFVIGDNNYETRTKALYGMDISDIITPKGNLVKLPKGRFRFMEMLGEKLVTIGRIMKDQPSDVKLHEQKVDGYAIMDLKTGKVISPWHNRIVLNYLDESVFFQLNESSKGLSIPLVKIRDRFPK